MKNKIKPKDILLGRSPILTLYRAIRRYVQSGGGKVVAIGGIEIQQWPEEGQFKFRVSVKVLGIKPKFSKNENQK